MQDETSEGRWRPLGLALFLAALYAVAFGVRVYATQARVSAGHGDVAGYYHVARNLASGRGFVQDFLSEYLNDPRAIPAPSNTWWLPLPSIIAAAGMRLAGDTGYAAAKYAMIAVSSLVPLLVFFAGWFLLRSRTAGVAGAILALGFHLYLDQPNATLSHGPYALFAAAGLLIVMAWREHPRLLPWFGLCLGLTYLCRGDGQALAVGLAVTLVAEWRSRRRVPPARPGALLPWRSLLLAAGLFAAVVAPWWARNLEVLGEPMPSGVAKITWGRGFEDWFVSDTSRLDARHYLEWGWDNILDQKWVGVRDALVYTPFFLFRSVTREQGLEPDKPEYRLAALCKWVLTPLSWLGLALLLRRRPAAVGLLLLQIVLLALVYGILFPSIGRESYRSSLFSVLPVFLVAIVAGLSALLSPLARRAPRAGRAALVAGALLLSAGNVAFAMPYLRAKCAGVEATLAPYRAFGAWARRQGLADETFLVRNPWEFTVETGMKSAIVPSDGARGLLDRARLYDARYLVDENPGGMSITAWRPAVAALIGSGALAPAFPRDPPPNGWTVYAIR